MSSYPIYLEGKSHLLKTRISITFWWNLALFLIKKTPNLSRLIYGHVCAPNTFRIFLNAFASLILPIPISKVQYTIDVSSGCSIGQTFSHYFESYGVGRMAQVGANNIPLFWVIWCGEIGPRVFSHFSQYLESYGVGRLDLRCYHIACLEMEWSILY